VPLSTQVYKWVPVNLILGVGDVVESPSLVHFAIVLEEEHCVCGTRDRSRVYIKFTYW
jgi:hypothetical protein